MAGNSKEDLRKRWELTPLIIAAIYAFLGALWVLFAERVLFSSSGGTGDLLFLHGFLMLTFVVVSAFILFFLINRYSKGIRRSERQYRRTIDALRDGILVLDRELRCVLWNETLCSWCEEGGVPVPVKGQEVSELLSPLSDTMVAGYGRVAESGTATLARGISAVGSRSFPSETRIIPVVDRDGTLGTLTVIRDITEQEQLDGIRKEMLRSMEKTAVDFAVLSDQIRNPLQIIVGMTSMEDGAHHDTILAEARQIDRIVDRLDRGWVEAEKIKSFLKEHYGDDGSDPSPAGP
jgi:PAS domain S-box-containing protein